ncbi:MAG: hypothetical protein NTU63_00835 [Candidatus Pacearchaeota archaeon]|nr:hypothetical protein [Candidatus Pacearchaeota archaeon]
MLTPYLEKVRREFVEEMEEKERDILNRYIQNEKGEIKVDWSRLIEDKKSFLKRASEGIEPMFYNHILRYLEIKGILTYSEGFIPFGCSMDLSPSNYRFTRQEDAEAFAKAEFKGALYPVGIAKILNSKAD